MNLVVEGYTASTTVINGVEFESLKRSDSDYSIIHGKDLDSGEDEYYTYDSKTNTLIRYTDEEIKPYKEQLRKYKKMISILIIETIFIILVLIGILINKMSKDKKRREKLEELKRRKEEKELSKKKTKKEK